MHGGSASQLEVALRIEEMVLVRHHQDRQQRDELRSSIALNNIAFGILFIIFRCPI